LDVLDDHARGLFLGLLLGDALGTVTRPQPSLTGTCSSQLACFTLEGLIRAAVRGREKGICHPPSVVWYAWQRWAHLQGIHGMGNASSLARSDPEQDGWLRTVDVLATRRGSAPATITALRSSPRPPTGPAPGGSCGHHALTWGLVAALYCEEGNVAALAGELAAWTHGHPEAIAAAELGAHVASALIREGTTRSVSQLQDAADVAARLTLSASPGTAPHALLHGARAAAAGRDFGQVLELSRPHGDGAVTTAAALFGALNGVFALPQKDLARLELAWVGDVLVHDALTDRRHKAPGGRPASISWARYPGG
jgi:ADP-ribosylglycohydrolase